MSHLVIILYDVFTSLDEALYCIQLLIVLHFIQFYIVIYISSSERMSVTLLQLLAVLHSKSKQNRFNVPSTSVAYSDETY